MDFIFERQDSVDFTNLLQGDLLIKNEQLSQVLEQAHSYYAQAADYTHFMVLTQNCDLVRRYGRPKARYITLAAVRPFSTLLDRKIPSYRLREINGFSICDRAKEEDAKNFLERILHNTVDGFFFIRKLSHPAIIEDMCVFLALSIALRVDHYDICLKSKIAQLSDVFAAKVGWAVGNMYSRVGTPDIEESIENPDEYKKAFYEDSFAARAVWVSGLQYDVLKQKLKDFEKANPDKKMSYEDISAMIQAIDNDIDYIAEKIVNVLERSKIVTFVNEDRERAMNALRNDPILRKSLKKAALNKI